MKSEKLQVDCIALKRELAMQVSETIANMTPEEELAYWRAIRERMQREQAEAAERKSGTPDAPDSHAA